MWPHGRKMWVWPPQSLVSHCQCTHASCSHAYWAATGQPSLLCNVPGFHAQLPEWQTGSSVWESGAARWWIPICPRRSPDYTDEGSSPWKEHARGPAHEKPGFSSARSTLKHWRRAFLAVFRHFCNALWEWGGRLRLLRLVLTYRLTWALVKKKGKLSPRKSLHYM